MSSTTSFVCPLRTDFAVIVKEIFDLWDSSIADSNECIKALCNTTCTDSLKNTETEKEKENTFIKWFCIHFFTLDYNTKFENHTFISKIFIRNDIIKLYENKVYRYWKLCELNGIKKEQIINPSFEYNPMKTIFIRKTGRDCISSGEFPYISEPKILSTASSYQWALDCRTFERLGYKMDSFPPTQKGGEVFHIPKKLKKLYYNDTIGFRKYCYVNVENKDIQCVHRSNNELYVIENFKNMVKTGWFRRTQAFVFKYDPNTITKNNVEIAFKTIFNLVENAACLARDITEGYFTWAENKQYKRTRTRKKPQMNENINKDSLVIVKGLQFHKLKSKSLDVISFGEKLFPSNSKLYFIVYKHKMVVLMRKILARLGEFGKYSDLIDNVYGCGASLKKNFFIPIPLLLGYHVSGFDQKQRQLTIEIVENTDEWSESPIILHFIMSKKKCSLDPTILSPPWNIQNIVSKYYSSPNPLDEFFNITPYLQHILLYHEEDYFKLFKYVYENDKKIQIKRLQLQ